MLLYSEQDEIKLDPPYQRMGGVWTKEKKQLLIDSILNDYDLPKIYFHIFDREKSAEIGFEYAVIDGRQRLETIWEFIDGKFYLSEDFEFQRDTTVNLSGLSYDDIAQQYPKIKIQFDSFVLPVVGVETDDEDLIEDMFSRLNEAVPLNAAEKRNSIGGELVKSIREISEHDFFKSNVNFTNRRYQHREVVARFLLLEDSLCTGKIIDTKKVYLDSLAKRYKDQPEIVERLSSIVVDTLNDMAQAFGEKDPLLRSQGNMTVYYLVFRLARYTNQLSNVNRNNLLSFNEALRENREIAQNNYEESSFELLEYDRLTQQGTNDASNLRERVLVLSSFLGLDLCDPILVKG